MRYIVALVILVLLVSCGGSSSTTTDSVDTTSQDTLDIKVFFSKTSGAYYDGGVDNVITQDIENAKSSIYMAMYDFTNSMILDALIDAKKRGVDVEVTTDDATIDEDNYQKLLDEGIRVSDDNNPNALMHDKFLLIDGTILWSGSGNYTVYSFYRNNENYVRVESKDFANAYQKEFMLLSSNDDTSYKGVDIGDVDIYFSPDANFVSKIVELIDNAKTSIYFLAFSFTNKDIADALIEAKKRGVDVKGVFDEGQNAQQTYSQYDYLLSSDIDVKLDGSSYKQHSKVIIIDNTITITGSYNFTKKANYTNNENSLVIKSQDIAKEYKNNFDTAYSIAK